MERTSSSSRTEAQRHNAALRGVSPSIRRDHIEACRELCAGGFDPTHRVLKGPWKRPFNRHRERCMVPVTASHALARGRGHDDHSKEVHLG
jgi:hypothetical protein